MENREIIKIVGTNIKKMRKQQGITAQELAEAVGSTRSSISNLENGLQGIGFERFIAIAQVLNCQSLDELFKPTPISAQEKLKIDDVKILLRQIANQL